MSLFWFFSTLHTAVAGVVVVVARFLVASIIIVIYSRFLTWKIPSVGWPSRDLVTRALSDLVKMKLTIFSFSPIVCSRNYRDCPVARCQDRTVRSIQIAIDVIDIWVCYNSLICVCWISMPLLLPLTCSVLSIRWPNESDNSWHPLSIGILVAWAIKKYCK